MALLLMRLDIPANGGTFYQEVVAGYVTRLFTVDGEAFEMPQNGAYSLVDAEPAVPGWYVEPAPPEPPAPPPAPVPSVISDRQFYQALAVAGLCTKAEALQAVKVGELPAQLAAIVASIPDEDMQFGTEMLLSGAVEFNRDHPLVGQVGSTLGWTDAQIDDFWRIAGTL
mgnify:CR=1 FL=1